MTPEKAIAVLEEILSMEKSLLGDRRLPMIAERVDALQFAIDKLRSSQLTESGAK